MSVSASTRQIGIVVATYAAYGQSIVRGVIDAAESRPHWTLHLVGRHGPEEVAPERLREFDGCIAEVRDPAVERRLLDAGCPAIAVTGDTAPGELPKVIMDQGAIGRLAGRYFLEQGYRHLAFWPAPGKYYSDLRRQGLAEVAAEAGIEVIEATGDTPHDWLGQLPRPVAVFAATDALGAWLIETCVALNLRVPDEVAVLGVDNDELVCRAVRPALSSINMGAQRIGARAVEVLEDWLDGRKPPMAPLTVEPLDVITRVSTETLAVDHPETAQAIRLIRERACEGLTVRQLLREVPVARRTLEYQFQRRLRRSIHQEIRRVKIQRVRRLLQSTDWLMPEIAAESGFEYPSQMSTLFKKETGLTPTAYRRRYRSAPR